ncbi:MAG TPA: L-threonylcarbamoyladenylate synthase [Rubrivivax sp.]|nr:L-threonylcarbamoyladenylate synthase [Rubrivivax sp.]HPO19872.1 L-threonylcarbamoyladenylate synthase [Rubrivivax sp.]
MPLLPAADPRSLAVAAAALAAGELLAFPTETVYGLGARADDDAAVQRIFAAKGRPSTHPLIVHAADAAQAQRFAAAWPASAQALAEAFWPGPLTLIVRRAPGMAQAAAGGAPTIGLRVPAHALARALLREALKLGVPGVAAPSANRFGRVSATRAAHVVQEFGAELKVLDGGECPGGIESAIVDCSGRSGSAPALLRPGLLPRAQIEAVLGAPLRERDDASPRASGSLQSHYAPAAKLRLMSTQQLRDALELLGPQASKLGLAVYSRARLHAGRGVEHRSMPDDPAAAAHELFAALREFDARGAKLIWVEQPPDGADWEGVRDRLQRAAAE